MNSSNTTKPAATSHPTSAHRSAAGVKGTKKGKKPSNNVKAISLNKSGGTSPKIQSTKNDQASKQISFNKTSLEEGARRDSKKRCLGSAQGPNEAKLDNTAGLNQSTFESQQSNVGISNSWQQTIKREETQSTSWFDWIMCGQCTTQPELLVERKSARESGRAPKQMQSHHRQQQNRDLLDTENSMNASQDFMLREQRSRLEPVQTFDEFDKIIFDNPPSGIRKNEKSSASKTENQIVKQMKSPHITDMDLINQKNLQLDVKNVDDNLSESNMMLDIDESTPVSERTQLLYTGRELTTDQQPNVSAYANQHQTSSQEEAKSLKRKAQQSNTVTLNTAPRQDEQPMAYHQDYQREIIKQKHEEEVNHSPVGAQQQRIEEFGKNNFETNNGSTISSNESIPEEIEETASAAVLTSQTHLSAAEPRGPGRQHQDVHLHSQSMQNLNGLMPAQSILIQRSSLQTGHFGDGDARPSSFRDNGRQMTFEPIQPVEEQQSGIKVEEDSSTHMFAKLEQQVKAEERVKVNATSSSTTQEVVVVSLGPKNKGVTDHNVGLDEDDEFLRVERECQAYQKSSINEQDIKSTVVGGDLKITRVPTEQEQMMAQNPNLYSNKTTPVDPKGGPRVTSAIKRHAGQDGHDKDSILQEQLEGPITPRDTDGIQYQINKFDSLNRSDNELVCNDTGNKLSEYGNKHNQMNTAQKQQYQDSSDSGLVNIQLGQVVHSKQPGPSGQTQEDLDLFQNDSSSFLDPNQISNQQRKPEKSQKPPLQQRKVQQQFATPGSTYTSRKSPVVKQRSETQQTFGPSTRSTKKSGIGGRNYLNTGGISTTTFNNSSQSKLSTQNNQRKPANPRTKRTPIQSSGQKTANITTTEEQSNFDINSTAPNAQATGKTKNQQSRRQLDPVEYQEPKSYLTNTQRQKSSTMNSFGSLPANSPTMNKQRKGSIYKPKNPVIGQVSFSGPDTRKRSASNFKKGSVKEQNKSKMADIFSKYANVAQIDLTVKPRKEQSTGRLITIQKLDEPNQNESMREALRELGKSIRSNSQASQVERQHGRSASRKSLARDLSFSGDMTHTSFLQKSSIIQGNGSNIQSFQVQNKKEQKVEQRLRLPGQKSRSPIQKDRPPTNTCTDIYSESASHTSFSAARRHTPTDFKNSQHNTVRNTVHHGTRRKSKILAMDEIYKQYETQPSNNSQDQLKKAIRQMRKSCHSASSRGERNNHQQEQQRPITTTDIFSESSAPVFSPAIREENSNSRMSTKRADLTGESIVPRQQNSHDRHARREALQQAPLPRIGNSNRRVAKKESTTSQQTAMFGTIKKSSDTKNKTQRATMEPLPPIRRTSGNNSPQRDLKELTVLAAKGLDLHINNEQQSLLEEFEQRRRSNTVNKDALPSPQAMEKFVSYSKTRKIQRESSLKQVVTTRQRTNSNVRSSNHNASPTRTQKQRSKVTGFLNNRSSLTGLRPSLGKDTPQPHQQQTMFPKRQPTPVGAFTRSVSPRTRLNAGQRVPSSKRSLSVLNERSKDREQMASASPSRLSKIKSQNELSTAKKFKLEVKKSSLNGSNSALFINQQRERRGSHLSRGSRRSPGRMSRGTPHRSTIKQTAIGVTVNTKLKPAVPRLSRASPTTAAVKRQAYFKQQQQSSKLNVVNVAGSMIPGIAKTKVVNQQQEGVKRANQASTRTLQQARPTRNVGVTKVGSGSKAVGQKTMGTTTTLKRSRNNQNSSTTQFQSSFNNNNKQRGVDANKLSSTPRWN